MASFPNHKELKDFLEKKVLEFNHPSFIPKDPISVPHRFSKKKDIEIAGLFAAIFSWGNRTTIIQKSVELMNRMDLTPRFGNETQRRRVVWPASARPPP